MEAGPHRRVAEFEGFDSFRDRLYFRDLKLHGATTGGLNGE
jgi:hypothetical protein